MLEDPCFKDKADVLYRLHRSYKKFHFDHLTDKDNVFFLRIFQRGEYYRGTLIELSRNGYEIYHPKTAYPTYGTPPVSTSS